MKKQFLVGYLSVAALALNGPAAQAGLLHHCCCHKCCTYICCRPYNAFSPVCCGSVCCMGCCPMFGGMGGGMDCGPCGPVGCMPSCFNGCCPSYSSSGCCDAGCLPPAGAVSSSPAAPAQNGPLAPVPNGPTTPTITPANPAPLPTSQQWPAPMPYGVVQTAGYQQNYAAPSPAYYPGYYPGYYPTTPSYSVPNYWYGGSQ